MKKLHKLFFILVLFISSSSFATILNYTVDVQDPVCAGDSGTAKITNLITTGATGPYRYEWIDIINPGIIIATGDSVRLPGGTYRVNAFDDAQPGSVAVTRQFRILDPFLIIPRPEQDTISCFGLSDGAAILDPNGATNPPYSYVWSNSSGTVLQTTNNVFTPDSLKNVGVGKYYVTISNSLGCAVRDSVTMVQPPEITVLLTVPPVDCNGGSTTATATPSGGSGSGYVFSWSSSPGGNNSSIEPGLNAAGSPYSVTITDGDGCSTVRPIVISEPPPIDLTVAPDTVDCFGASTGTAVATVVGGTAPFTFSWSTLSANTTDTENNLSQGAYSVTVTDANLCVQSLNFRIEERDELDLGLDSIDVNCNGDANGRVTGTITGGIAPYTWVANDPANTAGNIPTILITNLDGGTYRVTVTDNLGCVKVDSIVVNEPPALTASFTGITNPSCVGGNDGTINVTFAGGNGTETFTWNTVPFGTVNRTGLSAGSYFLVITDNKGCRISIDTTLVDPAPILANLTFDEPSCFGGGNARVISTPSGGSGVYTNYNFGPGFTNGPDSILSNIPAGMYSVTITDSDNCTGIGTITVTEPANPFSLTIVPDSVNCNGESNGRAIATPNIPLTTGPYSWIWSDGANTTDSIVSGLSIGKYYVTATDGNGCQIVDSVIIEEPSPIVTAVIGTDLNCNGDASGSASANISNGNTPYSWSWSTTPAQTGTGSIASATDLDANTKYFLTVTDRKGCTKIDSVTLNEPIAFDLYLDSFRLVKCFGENNGAVFTSDSGGTGIPTYLWDDGPITQDRTDLTASATPYKIVATDANGCKDSVIQLITEPQVFAVTINEDSVSCAGASDGQATATATGGTEGNGYIYTWTTVPVQIGATATGLAPGTYTVNVVDSNGCTTSENVTIFEPIAITSTITSDSTSCSGIADGSATVTAAGGSPFAGPDGYTYLWDANAGSQITATATNLLANSPNFYRVTITDRNGCTKVDSVEVGEPTTLVLSVINQRNVDCAGNSTGAATINVVGGTAPITFSWNTTPIITTATATGLPADTFIVTVSDGNGCNDNIQVIITEPDTLKADIPAITAIAPTCLGATDGTALAVGTGGTAPYTFAWSTSPVQNTATAVGLEANVTYTVTITDDSLCTSTAQILLIPPVSVEVIDTNIKNVSCLGGNDGFIKVTAIGGTAPYTHSWNPSTVSGNTTDSIFDIIAGVYQDTIRDQRGCFIVETYTVTEPIDGITLSFDTTDVTCAGIDNGTAKVTAIGGTPPYTFSWRGAPAGNPNDSIFNLAPGTYVVTVTDFNGCATVDSTVVNPATPIILVEDPNNAKRNVTCADAQDGSINIVASGGTGVLSLEWYLLPDRATIVSTSSTAATNLAGGTYRILVIDGPCSDSIDVVITEPDSLKADIPLITAISPTCLGATDGSATAVATGGTPPYSFAWSTTPVQNTATAVGLEANVTYTVTVTDDSSCVTTAQILLIPPTTIEVSDTNIGNASCLGDNDGFIKVTAIGGTAPYTHSWNPSTVSGNNTDSIFGIVAGTYQDTITDQSGCFTVETYIVTEPLNGISLSFDTTDVGCSGINNGTAKVTAVGGTPGYRYDWRNNPDGNLSDSIFNLAVGTYVVTVTDMNGCTGVDSTVINPANPITLTIDPNSPVQDVTCAGDQDGSITLISSGGSGNLSLEWYLLPNRTTTIATNTNIVSNLSGGTYRILAIDGPCSDSIDIVVNEPDTLKAELNSYDLNCDGTLLGRAALKNITGGNAGGQSFIWTPDPGPANGQGTDSVFNLTPGNYSVRVFDLKGCSDTIDFTISPTNATFTFTDSVRNDSCSGAGNGYIEIIGITGGVAPYAFNWDDGSSDNPRTNLIAGTYTVTISDFVGCDSVRTYIITEPNTITATVLARPDTCGNTVGSAFIVGGSAGILGGTAPYTVTWPGGLNGLSVSNLAFGNYDAIVADANGCQITIPFNVGNVAPFTISFDVDSASCANFPDGAIRVSTSAAATNPITYNWTPSIPGGATPTGLFAGEYRLIVTDANGCQALDTVQVRQPDELVIDSVVTTDESCNPGSDGTATVFAKGGNTPYRYNWGNGFTTRNDTNNLVSGNYSVTIQDRKFCSDIFNFVVETSAPFTIDPPIVEDATCVGDKDGSIVVTLTGAIAPITYSWPAGSGLTTSAPTAVGSGVYILTVTDGSFCSSTARIVVDTKSKIQALITVKEDETCTPGMDGFAVVGAVSGIEPYSYAWTPNVISGAATDSAFNLGADNYAVTVTDALSCSQIVPVRIDPARNISINITALKNPTCFGDMDGRIAIEAVGGVAPYDYEWSPTDRDSILENVGSGIYSVTITDASTPPCVKVESVTIAPQIPISITSSSTLETCSPGNDATAFIGVTGGAPPLSYQFSPGGVVGGLPSEYTNLAAGSYTVTVTDDNGCGRIHNFSVSGANTFTINLTKKDPTCANGNDGEFFVSLSGGANPFTYDWTGGLSGADPKNATAGEYTILVTDALGCTASATDTLFDKAAITASFATIKETCAPGNDGSVTATAADGVAPYSYTWPIASIPGSSVSGTFGETFSNLSSGTFNVTIQDDNGCINILPFTIGNSAPFTVTSVQNNVSCKGLADGDITVTVTGVSTPTPETYLWTPNVGAANINNSSQSNLAAGSYGLTITDPGNNCVETDVFIITEPDTLVATTVITNVSCNLGGNDGQIILTPVGGTAPYFYNWGFGITSKDRSGLSIGTYDVIITDNNGCSFNGSYTLTNLPQFTVALDSTDVRCPGEMNGFINLTTTANSPTFLWNDGNMGQLRGGLSKGMYTVTVTDGITQCTVVDSIFVNEDDSLKMTFSLSDENCFPGMDGVAQVNTTTGGLPGYTYSFSGGTPIGSDVVNQLTAGTYLVTVRDQNNCTAVDSFKINTAAAFTASFTSTDVICPGDSSGTATITTANSSGTLTFRWPLGSVADPSQQDQSKLIAGTYDVTISDPANGCEEILSITINEPDSIKGNATITPENCNPGGNGSITLAPTGGDNGAYIFNWSGPGITIPTSQNQNNLSAGKYFVTITDGILCEGVDSFNVGFIVTTIPNLTTLNDGCSLVGLCAGAAQVKPTGGVAPYSYQWESPTGIIPVPPTTDSVGFLCAGNYFVTITDASGCDTILPFTINGRRIITPNPVVVGETCGATDNGSISVAPTGGQEPYTYIWSGSTFTDSAQAGLAPGAYSITITDATGCDTIINLNIDTENFDYTLNSTDLSCSGLNDGTATISIVGGTTGFTFDWNPTPTNGQGTAAISNLSVGTYFVTITNTNNGCAVIESVNIDPTTPINPNEVITDESCFGQNDGSIVLATVGGAGNYTYNWSSNVPAGTTNNATGLSAGTYDVTITDAGGCDTSISVAVNAASDIIAQITTNDATCANSGICDGSAELIVTSTGVFSYTWTPGIVVAGNDSAAINLCPGNYAVTITNTIGCSKVVPFVIGGPALIAPNIVRTDATCNISNGILTATPTGGTGTLTTEWLDNSFTSIGTGNSINSLTAGAYFLVVADNLGCRDTFPTNINDIGAETISISSSNNVSCFGGNNGNATVSFVCNDPGCTVKWFRTGELVAFDSIKTTITGLTAGDYYVEVRNNSLCLAVENFTITQPVGFAISETIVSNECFGGINGSITLSVSGGVGNFSYVWSPAPTTGQGTNSISKLSAGTYTVVISDGNFCDSTMTFDVTEPSEITSTFAEINSNCNQADGQIVATVSGGTVASPLAYDYQWFDGNNLILIGQTSDTLRNIAAGNYRLRVRDDNACQRLFNVSLSDQNGPTVVIDSVVNAGCFGESNGGVYITATGTSTTFVYNWLPTGAVSKDITNLSAGVYSVQVTDNLGCITNAEDTVFESSELIATILASDATCGVCNGTASVTVTGGTAPYTYLWSDGAIADNTDSLCGGNYTVVITDASGCSKSFDFGVNTIGGPTGETVSITPASCANSNDGSATITPIGGTAPYTFTWQHNGATTNSLNNLAAGTYFVQFSDVRRCSRTVQIDITSPTAIELNPQIVSSTCNQADGSILLNVTGGQPPYSYNWFTATLADTNFIDNRAVGLYPVSVTDANGCIESTTIAINNTGVSFIPTPIIENVTCFGQCDGSLKSGIPSGTPVDFRWLDDQRTVLAPINIDVENSVCAGDYFLEITTNPQGCKSFIPVTITEPDSITLSSSIVKDISCNDDCDGEIFINTRGGNILYTYSWNDINNQKQIPAFGLCAGDYTVTATDANGCSKTTSVRLENPPVLTASISSFSQLVCSADCNATATSDATGGEAPYTFTWSGGQIGKDPTNLCFGENILTVTDARGCSVTDTISITADVIVLPVSSGNPTVCEGELVNLKGTVTGSSATTSGWYEADTLFTRNLDTSFFRPVGVDTFYLRASIGTCVDEVPFVVNVVQNPAVNLLSSIRRFGDEPTPILLGNTQPTYTYMWTPNTDLDNDSVAQPITVTEEDIIYSVFVTDTVTGCTSTNSIEVIYSPNIDIPSGFTPNGDGTNDVWNIRLLEKYPNAKVEIYNRWGTLLYDAPSGYTDPWNGEYNGKELPIGTYYYLIDFKDPALKPVSGPITIIR